MAIKTIQLDRHVEGNRPTHQVNTDAAAASLVLATKGGTLIEVIATNTGADGYLQVHDAAALPANGAVPLITCKLAAGTSLVLETSLCCSNGITLAMSTTAGTLTTGLTMIACALVRVP